jgi:Flp pilus assembly protein TadG
MASQNLITAAKKQRRGSAMMEFCLLLPWYIFLFVGAFDFGFYAYGLIATSNAARVAATYCSATSSTCNSDPLKASVCTTYILPQLYYMPNVGSATTTCTASPITLTVTYPSAASCPDGNTCTTVTVAYVTPHMVPIPGMLAGQFTITKSITMRLAG